MHAVRQILHLTGPLGVRKRCPRRWVSRLLRHSREAAGLTRCRGFSNSPRTAPVCPDTSAVGHRARPTAFELMNCIMPRQFPLTIIRNAPPWASSHMRTTQHRIPGAGSAARSQVHTHRHTCAHACTHTLLLRGMQAASLRIPASDSLPGLADMCGQGRGRPQP